MSNPRTLARLMSKIEQRDGHWHWTAYVNGAGSPRLGYAGIRSVPAHRAFYAHFNGVIPDQLSVHSACGVALCVNPEHLRAFDPADEVNPNWQGGKVAHPLYFRWHQMVHRCHFPSNAAYKNYGARGIYVCDRWRDDFWAFVEDMGECPPGLSLDRVDNDGPYSPENCRWATPYQQVHNRRPTKLNTHCRRGHEFTADTTIVRTDGSRQCRTCRNAAQRKVAAS